MASGLVFAVAGAKGGVGKTTTSINLGVALADRGLDVVVVELDLAMANVVDFLSLPFDGETHPSMHDVLAGEASVTDAIVEGPGGIAVAPSTTSLDGLDAIDVSRLPDAIETFADQFDVVVLDTAAGMNSATSAAIGAADQTVLVSTPRVASVRDAEKTRTLVEKAGGNVVGVVMAKAGTGSAPEATRLAEFLGVDLLSTVPDDPSVPESQDAGVPVVERRPDSDAAQAYVEGAVTLTESTIDASADEGGTSITDMLPSKESLEARGWMFPGASDQETDAASETPAVGDVGAGYADVDATNGVTSDETQVSPLRPVSPDGGNASVTDDDRYDQKRTEAVEADSTAERSPDAPPSDERDDGTDTPRSDERGEVTDTRPSDERDDGTDTEDTSTEDEQADPSIAGRFSSLLRRSD